MRRAARADRGIRSISPAAKLTKTSKNSPWKKFDQRVLAPLTTFAVLRTISAIIGSPPTRLDKAEPSPTADRSRDRLQGRLYGSSLSATADALSNVSIPCTSKIEIA